MAGKIVVSTLQSDTDNSISFVANTGATIFSANLSNGIAGSFIGDGSVTNAKLAGSISNDKLAGSITGNKIATGQITGNLIATNAISQNNIVDGLITSEKINTSVFATTSNIFGVTANSNTFSNTIIIVAGNTAPINVGMLVSGSNVTPGTTVLSFNSSPPSGRSNITLSAATVGTNTNTAFSFYETNKVLSPGIAGPGLCKAWVNFNGTSVLIRAAYNVSSITDNGTGDYTVNFTTAISDANYSVTGALGGSTILGIDLTLLGATAPTTSAIRIGTRGTTSGTLTDTTYVDVAIFR